MAIPYSSKFSSHKNFIILPIFTESKFLLKNFFIILLINSSMRTRAHCHAPHSKNIRLKYFRLGRVLMKMMKFLCNEILELYGINTHPHTKLTDTRQHICIVGNFGKFSVLIAIRQIITCHFIPLCACSMAHGHKFAN